MELRPFGSAFAARPRLRLDIDAVGRAHCEHVGHNLASAARPLATGLLQVTVTLKQVSVGTELNIVQEGLPDAGEVGIAQDGAASVHRRCSRL
jgi:hypothetical protein